MLIFLWSWLMPTRDYILMFFALSGAIWNAGAGACIIGGLYWRRGNATGAAAALVTGATTSLLALCAQIWLGTERFTLNGQEILTTGSVLSVRKTSFLSTFPMFVPSLSWQNDRF